VVQHPCYLLQQHHKGADDRRDEIDILFKCFYCIPTYYQFICPFVQCYLSHEYRCYSIFSKNNAYIQFYLPAETLLSYQFICQVGNISFALEYLLSNNRNNSHISWMDSIFSACTVLFSCRSTVASLTIGKN
jgi:hypothetical protein